MGYLCWVLPEIKIDSPAACVVLFSAMWSWLCCWDYQQNRIAKHWDHSLFHLVNHQQNAHTDCIRDICLSKYGHWLEKGHSASMTSDPIWHDNQFSCLCFKHSHTTYAFYSCAFCSCHWIRSSKSCVQAALSGPLSPVFCVMLLACFACYASGMFCVLCQLDMVF